MRHPPYAGVARLDDLARTDGFDAGGDFALSERLAQLFIFAGRKRQAVQVDDPGLAGFRQLFQARCDLRLQRAYIADGIFFRIIGFDWNVFQIVTGQFHVCHSATSCMAWSQAKRIAPATGGEGVSPQSMLCG